jgi:hypothetical protein
VFGPSGAPWRIISHAGRHTPAHQGIRLPRLNKDRLNRSFPWIVRLCLVGDRTGIQRGRRTFGNRPKVAARPFTGACAMLASCRDRRLVRVSRRTTA